MLLKFCVWILKLTENAGKEYNTHIVKWFEKSRYEGKTMRNIIYAESAQLPELEWYVGNKEIHLLRYYEPEPGIFIAESRNVIDIALRQGYEPLSVVCTEKMLKDELLDRVGDVPIYVVDPDAAKKEFGYVLTGGISCAMRRKKPSDYKEILRDAKRIVVLEDVENPTNIGAIFRSAAAFGIDAVILSPACVDPLYRRAMRVSVGNALLIPWAYMCYSEAQWKEQGVSLLKQEGFETVAMALREDNIRIDDPKLKQVDRLAIFMGNEGQGLAESTIQAVDHVAKIPMMNGVDSLNVAVAAGLAMWELGRRG